MMAAARNDPLLGVWESADKVYDDQNEVEWIVPSVIQRGALNCFFGSVAAYKTTTGGYIACNVSACNPRPKICCSITFPI